MYKVVVIGAGSIGALKSDKYDNPKDSDNILTHAHAVYHYSETELVGILDSNRRKGYQAAEKWNTESLYSIKNLKEIKPDIVIVATPQETHYNVLQEVIKYNPKLVICEKPFCDNKQQAVQMMLAYRLASIPLLINYTRRFSAKIRKEVLDIQNGSLGKIYNCRIVYDRGFIRDACHSIDILLWMLGSFKGGCLIDNPIYDWSEKDPTYSAYLKFENCDNVNLTAVDGRDFDIFEIDFLGEKGRTVFFNHGLEINNYLLIEESTYGNYKTLDTNPIWQPTDLKNALNNLLDNAICHLERHHDLFCTAEDAIAVWNIIEYLLNNKIKYF